MHRKTGPGRPIRSLPSSPQARLHRIALETKPARSVHPPKDVPIRHLPTEAEPRLELPSRAQLPSRALPTGAGLHPPPPNRAPPAPPAPPIGVGPRPAPPNRALPVPPIGVDLRPAPNRALPVLPIGVGLRPPIGADRLPPRGQGRPTGGLRRLRKAHRPEVLPGAGPRDTTMRPPKVGRRPRRAPDRQAFVRAHRECQFCKKSWMHARTSKTFERCWGIAHAVSSPALGAAKSCSAWAAPKRT